MEYSRIIKPTPTFELPNQFLVWVAQKVLTRSDLDLLLTEYYKKRLESQLKNKEIYMNEDNSTESIVLSLPTHLPVPIDWISSLKLSSTKPFFPFLHLFFFRCPFLLFQLNLYLLPLVTIIPPALLFNLTLLNLPFLSPIYRHLLLLLFQSKV